ncbi:MAG: hypothetical protein WBL53_03480 [Pseudonocardiaceae bacterium]
MSPYQEAPLSCRPPESVIVRITSAMEGTARAPDHIGHHPRAPGLVRGAQAGSVVAVEVLVEHQVVLPARVVL